MLNEEKKNGLALTGYQHMSPYFCFPGDGGVVLKKVLYGEAPPRGPTPYPFIYHFFFRKGTPFVYLLKNKSLKQ